MSRRNRLDVAVVGGGVVGSAAALTLAGLDLQVALLETREPPRWQPAARDLRVYAFAPDNATLLDALGVWNAVRSARLQAYRRMRVWDAAGGGELAFDADRLGRRELGWIVEHGLLVDRLWSALPAAGVQVRCPASVVELEAIEDGARLRLEDGSSVDARLVIGADGAQSSLRGLAGIGMQVHDYAQRGVVAYVGSERSHQGTAWQRFLPGGPLALLPFADGDCSIVWTLPENEAARVLALDDQAFGRELTMASGACIGALRPSSPRAAFPLRRLLVESPVAGRVLLVGDAAHVVHPLAGQGVNLGLRDVAALADAMRAALARGTDYAGAQLLARWARTRRSENAVAAHAFGTINRIFSNDGFVATVLRGPLLGLAGRMPPLARAFWRHAAGA